MTTQIMGSSKVKVLTLDQVVLTPEQIEEEKRKFEEQRREEERKAKEREEEKEKRKPREEEAKAPIAIQDYPLFGPGRYQDVMAHLTLRGLLRPTTAQTLNLINLALKNPNDENFKIILSKVKHDYLWTSTENLWGKEDVIVYDNIDGNMPSGRKRLLKRMKDGDSSISLVPYGFKTESQSISEFIKNPYVLAQIRNLPLEILIDVVNKFGKSSLYLFTPDKFERKNVKRYSAVQSCWFSGELGIVGSCDDSGINGYSFGINRK